MTAKLSVLALALALLVACASEPPKPAPLTLPPTATPAPLPPTATPTLVPPTATPMPLPPTATPEIVQVIASKVEDLVGVWGVVFVGEPAYMQFKADGTYRLASTVASLGHSPLFSGTIWFTEAGLNVKDSMCDGAGTYKAWVQRSADASTQLILSVISDPTCPERAQDWKKGMRWVQR